MKVRVFTRVGCHLCEDAIHLLESQRLRPETVDIDQHPEYLAEFNACVPVVEINGVVRFRGKVNPVLLRRLLSQEREELPS